MNEKTLIEQLRALTDGVPYLYANLANASALLYETLPQVNWVGFYLLKDGELWLGPFQGRPACVRIMIGKGVCGTAVKEDRTLRVDDVHEFPGHIACDAASRSELVIPLHAKGKTAGVLDIDSPAERRFTAEDQQILEAFCKELERLLEEQFE